MTETQDTRSMRERRDDDLETLIDAISQIYQAPNLANEIQIGSPPHTVADILDESEDADSFWEKIRTNLSSDQSRVVFLVEEVSSELQRLVELLNDRLGKDRVLALGLDSIAPQTSGGTIGLRETTHVPLGPPMDVSLWDERSFFQRLTEERPVEEAAIASAILGWARDRGLKVRWEGDADEAAFVPWIGKASHEYAPIAVSTSGVIEVRLNDLRHTSVFSEVGAHQELLGRLAGVPMVQENAGADPRVRSCDLTDAPALEALIGALDWIVDRVQSF